MEGKPILGHVPVELITPHYHVKGKIAVTSAGLIGAINESSGSSIEILEAWLSRLHRPGETVARFDAWEAVKHKLVAVLLEQRTDLGPPSITRGGFGRMVSYKVWASMEGFEMFGVMEAPGKFSFAEFMFQGSRHFVPLYNATLIPVFFPQLVSRAPVLLFNRQMVEGLSIISKASGPLSPQAVPPS
ncbi:MAG: hypothetical protein ABSB61_06970 [Anaerolineales bacterium]|jgi:hypothetical protein